MGENPVVSPGGPQDPSSGGPRTPSGTPVGEGRLRRPLLMAGLLLPLALLVFSCSGCSPIYVARAGWTEAKILAGRRPISEVLEDPATDVETRRKLLLARQARAFAIHMMRLDAGDSYTTFTRVDSEVLAWIISAAYRDRLESKTWWFPIVGRVPYRGYASRGAAEKAERKLAGEGFDTYLRPTTAFSTLGWFSDPLLSTVLGYDEVALVQTVLHELSHNHLWVPDHTRFNESYATFVGHVGAIRFFCGPGEIPSDPEHCPQARTRWAEYQAFSAFLDVFAGELQAIYARADLTTQEKLEAREALFLATRKEYDVAPDPASDLRLVRAFLEAPLNNAVLLGRMRYSHRLPDFQALLDAYGGNLPGTIEALKSGAKEVEDPFQLLPSGPDRTGEGPET
ncbi:MAG: aminopeptidase [Longimicrobiales bacterium]